MVMIPIVEFNREVAGCTTGDVSFLGGTIVQIQVGTSSSQPIGSLVAAKWVCLKVESKGHIWNWGLQYFQTHSNRRVPVYKPTHPYQKA